METTIVKCLACDVVGTEDDLMPCSTCKQYMCHDHCCDCPVTIYSAEEFNQSFGFDPPMTPTSFPMVISASTLDALLTVEYGQRWYIKTVLQPC
jgi:hypothetical protein